jgi:hypothetical protein
MSSGWETFTNFSSEDAELTVAFDSLKPDGVASVGSPVDFSNSGSSVTPLAPRNSSM